MNTVVELGQQNYSEVGSGLVTGPSSRIPHWLQQARSHWENTGATRPPFAIEPSADQESVWDYPRPPTVAEDSRTVDVLGASGRIASTTRSIRVLETSHPPAFYLPGEAVGDRLVPAAGRSFCEWKGQAEYLAEPGSAEVIGWRYPKPYPEFANWAGWVSFYPDRVECRVDGHRVRGQAGGFYGGWITPDVVGPFKGDAGTSGW